MKQIKLNDKVGINLEKLISGKLLLNAGSGGGKSYAIRRILEQSFGEIPHLILDTEGEFSSLREKYDYILIGKGFDIAADPRTAALLALRLWEERVSAIIDLYELSPWDRQVFVRNFVDALINAPKKLWKPVLLVIDEAHEYAPENDKSDSGRALHLLASKGRKRQIGAIFATQRISSLSKNIVASCKNKLIGYASETNDVKRAAFELGFTPQEALRLRDLDPGEFYAFGPALTKEVTKIKIGSVATSHEESFGSVQGSKVAPASEKVKKALAKLADLPQAAAEEARTVAELKAALTAARNEVKKSMAIQVAMDPQKVDQIRATVENQWEIRMQKFKDALYQKLLKSHGNVFGALNKLLNDIDGLKQEETVAYFDPSLKKIRDIRTDKIYGDGKKIISDEMHDISAATGITMGAGERQVLIAIAQQPEGMTREHITVQTGYKRSTRDAYIQRLVQKGYVMLGERIHCSPAGFQALGNDYEPLPTGRELLEYHLRKLPDGESKILNLLYAAGGNGETRDYISETTGFKRSTRDAYIQRLATRQLVVVEGQTIRISEHLV